MRRDRIVTTLLVTMVVILLSVLALRVRVGATADSVALLRTSGMTCSSCSGVISKALQSVQGVAVTEVDVDGGLVAVGYDTRKVRPSVLADKVTAAGFASTLYAVVTPEEFKKTTGRGVGQPAAAKSGCCGGRKGCGST